VRVAFLAANARAGDGVGNHLAEMARFFLERNADLGVFVESGDHLHPLLRPHVRIIPDAIPHEDRDYIASSDLLLVQYTHYYPLLDLLPTLLGSKTRIILDYQGVTPLHLWGSHNREGLARGHDYRGLVWCADAALVHSLATLRELQDATGFSTDRIHRLGFPVETSRFTPGESSLRHELKLENAQVLLFVGRLAPNKRVPVLIEAVARLRDRNPAVHAVIVGTDEDLYRDEADRCRALATARGVFDRVHFLGQVNEDRLLDAYRAADVFVMPSLHEGFCIPVMEAMACGVPVVAARASALPETVGSAGLTFAPDDADDLARQVARVLDWTWPGSLADAATDRLRIAVVTARYGDDFVGGAEASLKRMAEVLHGAGHGVEVFTLAGKAATDALPVHVFPADRRDPDCQAAAQQRIAMAHDGVSPEDEREYLTHAANSRSLLDALRQRCNEFDAILVGPYLLGLSLAVSRELPAKTILVPCFHDEPTARLSTLLEAYRNVAGIFYHSPEEQAFAEAELGINHPGATCCGTFLPAESSGNPERGRELVGTGHRYLLYAGRYCAEKGLPTVIDHARRYAAANPERFTFAFAGQGDAPIPASPWTRDLGFLSATELRDAMAGAAAVVLLSRRESLSLVALESWAQATPVIADAGCPVLAGHMERSGGGRAVDDYDDFAAALDDLWQHPDRWQTRGRQGQEYVALNFGNETTFLHRLEAAIRDINTPLAQRMRGRGLERAQSKARPQWRDHFGKLVEAWLDAPSRPIRECLEIEPRTPEVSIGPGQDSVVLSVRITNRGTVPVVPEGPARVVLRSQLVDATGTPIANGMSETALPALIMPQQSVNMAVLITVPPAPGSYDVVLQGAALNRPLECAPARVRLTSGAAGHAAHRPDSVVLATALARAEELHRLPDDYTDVTTGRFAALKRRIKKKLLNNFKLAYMDIAMRQQSAVNRHLLDALRELTDYCAALEHALAQRKSQEPSYSELRASHSALEERLSRLEARLQPQEEVIP